MPATRTSISRDSEHTPVSKDDGHKRSGKSYRTYGDVDGHYTPYSDESFESDYDEPRGEKRSTATFTERRTVKKKEATKTTGNKSVRHYNKVRISPNQSDFVSQRVLSARRLKMNELKNEIELVSQELFQIKKENLLLRRTQVIQEKSLERFEDKESNLPQLIEGHSREVRALREQIRRYREKSDKSLKSLHDTEDELAHTRKQLKKLQALADDKDLVERDELSRKLNGAETRLETKDDRIKELEKHVENLEKNHIRELKSEMRKVKEARSEAEALKQSMEKVQLQLKEKEKELEVANIYHGRFLKAQQRSLPALDAPPSPRPPFNRKAQTPDASPREKARQLEEKRREIHKKRREVVERSPLAIKNGDLGVASRNLPPQPPSERKGDLVRSVHGGGSVDREDSWEKIRAEQERLDAAKKRHVPTPPAEHNVGNSLDRFGEEERVSEEDARRRRADAARLREQQDEEERRLRDNRRQAKEESERREKAAKEERENDARIEKERWEREERRRQEHEKELKEREERARREKFEREEKELKDAEERKARGREDEQRRLAADAAAAEERRRKDVLLQKMKEIDNKKDVKATAEENSLISSLSSQGGASSKKREFAFRDADENLHQGVPVKTGSDRLGKTTKPSLFDDAKESGSKGKPTGQLFSEGYVPSFDADSNQHQSTTDISDLPDNKRTVTKKSNLLDSLFGSEVSKSNPKSSFGDDDIFSSATKAKPVADRRAYPWESDLDISSKNEKGNVALMQTRQRLAPSVIHSKPTVNAIGDFEDDIEELAL